MSKKNPDVCVITAEAVVPSVVCVSLPSVEGTCSEDSPHVVDVLNLNNIRCMQLQTIPSYRVDLIKVPIPRLLPERRVL